VFQSPVAGWVGKAPVKHGKASQAHVVVGVFRGGESNRAWGSGGVKKLGLACFTG
jgi:hypothetical protein